MIKVTFVDDTHHEFPTAESWMLLKGAAGGHPPTFTADIVLLDSEDSPVAIIGTGTFKAITKGA